MFGNDLTPFPPECPEASSLCGPSLQNFARSGRYGTVPEFGRELSGPYLIRVSKQSAVFQEEGHESSETHFMSRVQSHQGVCKVGYDGHCQSVVHGDIGSWRSFNF